MALVKSDIKNLIISKMNAAYGFAEAGFDGERDKYADVMADVFIEILLVKFDITGQTNVVSGSSAGSYPTAITKG